MRLSPEEIQELKALVDQGLMSMRKHPSKKLFVYKYSKIWEIRARSETKSNREYVERWSNLQLMARGLVLTEDYEIVSRPFRKFFNIQEHDYVAPKGPFRVFEKLDGSAIVVSRYQDELIINTLGSFDSEQAKAAEVLLNEKYADLTGSIVPGFTFVFEILYPENQIVIRYSGDPMLVLLAVIDNETGQDLKLDSFYWPDKPLLYSFSSIEDITKELKKPHFTNEEGFVVMFDEGNQRIKFKFEEYVRIHRIRSNLTPKAIWELLREGKDVQDLGDLPDEFIAEINSIKQDLIRQYEEWEVLIHGLFFEGMDLLNASRKEFALWATSGQRKEYAQFLFLLADKRDYSKNIWDKIKPRSAPEDDSDDDA